MLNRMVGWCKPESIAEVQEVVDKAIPTKKSNFTKAKIKPKKRAAKPKDKKVK